MRIVVFNILLIILAFGLGLVGILLTNPLLTIGCAIGSLIIAFNLPLSGYGEK
jgi:hypothetical protein